MIQNLLENASKYGDSHQAIELILQETEGRVTLQICNHGPTIPASEKARIFRPHYRSPSHAEQAVEGSGLGLAIVRETAAQLGGSVSVSDWANGEGTCFTVTLPSVPDGAVESA